LAKVHKEKDTNRKLQIKLKQLTNLLQDAKLASEREVEELSARLKIELLDRKQSEQDMKVCIKSKFISFMYQMLIFSFIIRMLFKK
jgi:hypothetical protein